MNRDGAAYWIPAFAGMTPNVGEGAPPLPLWERSDRIVRCDPGEGLRYTDGPAPLTPTLSHKGRGSEPPLPTNQLPTHSAALTQGTGCIVNLYGEQLLTFARTEVISTTPGTSGLLALGLESTMTGSTRSSGGLDDRRKRLLFRCWHRGTREMDLILGRFADSEIANLSDDELMQFELLMDVPDPDLYAALTGDMPPAPEYANRLFDRIKSFRADHDA